MHVVSHTMEKLPNFDLKVILIKSSDEMASTDNPDINGWVDTLFKSSDILDALEWLKLSDVEKKSKHRVKKKR